MEGHIHILDWLHSQGTRSGCDNIPDQVAYYGKHKVKVLEWLRSYRYPTGRDIKNGKLQYDYDVLIEYARKYDREHKFDGIIV
jgi:hypothetical protein